MIMPDGDDHLAELEKDLERVLQKAQSDLEEVRTARKRRAISNGTKLEDPPEEKIPATRALT